MPRKPRGRNGPPQDSIDSILLAISRRETIDDDTMSHYFDRLDEEWTSGARAKVLHLLRTSDISAHNAAMIILSELATDFDLEDLEDLVADPTVSDMAKLTVAPVLKELDSDMADEGIIEYLNDPEAAMQQMQVRLLELVGQSELGVESVLEDVLSMPVERRLGFIHWLGDSMDPRAAKLLIPLLENASGKIVTAALDSLEQLGSFAAEQSIPALNYFVSHNSNRKLKEQARSILGRLTMYSAPGAEDMAMANAHEYYLPLHEVRVSFIDGSGAQMIMFSWQRPDGLLKGVNILYQDQWGIKDCYGTDEMDAERWSDLVNEMDSKGFGSFAVPFDYGKALVTEARLLNKHTRRKLPIAYAIWRPFIEGSEPEKSKPPAVSTMLEMQPLTPEIELLAANGHLLYQFSEFSSWMYEPLEELGPYIDRYWANRSIFDGVRQSHRTRARKRSQREQKSQVSLESVIAEALNTLIDDTWRLRYEARLRRQGMLFKFADRNADADLVRAVASALHPNSGLPATDQPFLYTMMGLSIEQGPLRAMMEALEVGDFGSAPIDLFPDKE
ncbi:MAG TPA: hypothetical protein VKR42_07530 [Ktedonobacteraceae bacterium]|nr:hypothetical protein [Ktedonobacteraceae bacterium]